MQFADSNRGNRDPEPSSLTEGQSSFQKKADLQGSRPERKELLREGAPEICAGVPLSLRLNNSQCRYRVKLLKTKMGVAVNDFQERIVARELQAK